MKKIYTSKPEIRMSKQTLEIFFCKGLSGGLGGLDYSFCTLFIKQEILTQLP